jgi:hypothetical protein
MSDALPPKPTMASPPPVKANRAGGRDGRVGAPVTSAVLDVPGAVVVGPDCVVT